MGDFGFFAYDVIAKVTLEPGKFGRVIKIPVSIGFKNQDKWANEFFDVVVFESLHTCAENINKGDKIQVSGRINLTEWTNKRGETKKTWQILADKIEPYGAPVSNNANNDVPDFDDDVPF